MDLVTIALQYLSTIPKVKEILLIILSILIAIPALVTAAVSIWHGLVQLVSGAEQIALLLGLKQSGSISSLADKMKVTEAKLDGGESRLLSVIDRISAVALPILKPPAPPSS